MKRQHAPSSSKPIIGTAKVDGPDPVLFESRCTHNARLHSYIQVCRLEHGLGVGLQYLCDCNKFGMSRSLWKIFSCLAIRFFFFFFLLFHLAKKRGVVTYVH